MKDKSSIAITGSGGFLGQEIRKLLEKENYFLHILTSREKEETGKNHKKFNIRLPVSDVSDISKAIAGCRTLIHLAGMVSRNPDDGPAMMSLHVEGMRKIMEAAKEAGIKRIILMSTSGTTGISRTPETRTDESPYAYELAARWPYYSSKIYQEKLAITEARKYNIELICLRPSLVLGPGDQFFSSTEDVDRFLKNKVPAAMPGGLSFVDVRDVAQATLESIRLPSDCLNGKPRTYLLGSSNMPFEHFFFSLAEIAGKKPPRLHISANILKRTSQITRPMRKKMIQHLDFDPVALEMACYFWYIDSERAKAELKFEPRPAETTLKDTITYIRSM